MTSDELKEAMKESPKRYTNPFLSDEENEKVNLWTDQELECLKINNDSTNNREEDENFTKSLAQCNVPLELFNKETELYTDKTVMECELPEFLVCYKENAFHVKDICVDEGITHGETILLDEDNHDQFLKPELLRFPPTEVYLAESNLCSETNGNVDTDLPVLEPTNHHMDVGDNRDEDLCTKSDDPHTTNDHTNMGNINIDTEIIPDEGLQNSIPEKDYKDCEDNTFKERGTNEEVIESIVPRELKNVSKDDNEEDGDESAEDDGVPEAIDIQGREKSTEAGEEHVDSSADLIDNVSTEEVASNSVASLQQDRPLPSLKSLLDAINSSKSAVVGNEAEQVSTTNVSNESMMEGNNGKSPTENVAASNNVAIVNPVQRGEGESSFSVANPVSGLITYSGPIAFSGSVSIRSDSSTTSTRSFAFPILQTEWNSSPVRMAKADRRRLQKHRGWRHGLLCCRF